MKTTFIYPIVHLFEKDKNIYAQKSKPQIASISKIDSFNNSIVLDSAGSLFVIKKAFKISWLYFFGFHPLIKGRTAKIDYEYSNIEKISLDKCKIIMIQKLSEGVNNGFWYTKKQIPSLIQKIESSKDYKEIIDIFI
jgi:hypothetical protein